MAQQLDITVRGGAIERAQAERATVTVGSRWAADDPSVALEVVARAHARVVGDARRMAESGAVASWHADRARIGHHEEWVGEGQPQRIVYTASASATVEFADPDALGAWIGELGTERVHEIGHIRWSLDEDTERELASRARAGAVEDARRRAADYARAAGLGEPAIAELREPGTSTQARPAAKERMVLAAGAADAAPEIELEAGIIEVRAAIEARFVAEAMHPGE